MGGNIRKTGPAILIDGQESKVLTRDSKDDEARGWSIVSRPYRKKPDEDALSNLSSENPNCTCLLAGNRVLMADGSHKAIEDVRVGDSVMTMSGPAKVQHCEKTRVGMTRKVIELRGLGDECLIMTDDHPLWVSRPDHQHGGRKEWWGTYNIHQVMYEMNNMTGYDFRELPVPLHFDLPEQVAHVTGWMHVRPIYHHVDPSMEVFHLVVDSGCSFIAEGFCVISHLSHEQGPQAPWVGLNRIAAAEEFVHALIEPTT